MSWSCPATHVLIRRDMPKRWRMKGITQQVCLIVMLSGLVAGAAMIALYLRMGNALMSNIPLGTYCLATKYDDGEAWDHYAVGFYAGEIFPGRHSVVDHDGKPYRASGFRRCEPITQEQGHYIVNTPGISNTGFKLWDYIHRWPASRGTTTAQLVAMHLEAES